MKTIRLLIEYDGGPFAGWQVQRAPEGVRTVQGELERAVFEMTSLRVPVRAASRTDAGVHARGQVVAFDVERETIPPIGFERGLTAKLRPSIVIRRAEDAPLGFDPRREARGKRYRYTFWNDRQPSALDHGRSWFVRERLDLGAMRLAGEALLGTHDFSAFRSSSCEARHAVRTLYCVELERGEYARVHLTIVGNAFVKNMVRIIAGTLRDVGAGRTEPCEVAELLAAGDRARAGMTAPAAGLCLEEVIYDERLPPRPGRVPGA